MATLNTRESPSLLALHNIRLTRLRALIAEGDAERRHRIADVLTREGFAVAEAGSGVELNEIVKRCCREDGGPPAVVIVDADLPRNSGLNALRNLRSELGEAVVLVTSDAADESVFRDAGEVGAMGVFDSPLDPGLLRDVVVQLLARPALV